MRKGLRHTQGRLLISLFIIASMTWLIKPSASEGNLPRIYMVNPLTGKESSFIFYTNTTAAGDRFNVTLRIDNVTDLFAYQIWLIYDPTHLNATEAWIPVWDPEWVFYGKNAFPTLPYMEVNYVQIGATVFDDTPFDGNGTLAVIEFEIRAAPDPMKQHFSLLNIDNDDTFLLGSGGFNDDIPSTKIDGNYRYVWLEPGLSIQPSRHIAVTLETFDVEVWLNNVTSIDSLVGVEFKLRYNSTLLDVIQVVNGSFFNGFDASFNYNDDDVENLTITNHLNPPYNTNFPKGNGSIATITFQGIFQDYNDHTSPLELLDIQLLNDLGTPITPISPPKNGSYTILHDNSSLITIKVEPTTVTIGSSVTVSGDIRPPKTNVNVTIYYRQVNQPWINLTTVQTGLQSNYSYIWTPTELGTLELKANWTGDSSNDPSQSDPPATLTIKKVTSTITIEVSPATVTVGANVTVSGTVTPTKPGVNVSIHYRLVDAAWDILETVKTNSSSQYIHVWKTTKGGKYELYASWPGDNDTSAAQKFFEGFLTIEKLPSKITIDIDPTIVTVGENVTITGSLNVTRDGVDVAIGYRLNGTAWTRLATVKTDANSNYNYTWTARKRTLAEEDAFQFYASWSGDDITSGATSQTVEWLTVLKTNSTITIDINPENTTALSNVIISGIIDPEAQAQVSIHYRLTDASTWTLLTIVETDLNGIYSYAWASQKQTLNSSETYDLKANWSGSVSAKGAESAPRSLTVTKAQSTITVAINPQTTTVGSSVIINGTVTPANAGINVNINHRPVGGNWSLLATVETNSEGHYQHTWQPPPGTYEVRANISRDKNLEPVTSIIIAFTVEKAAVHITATIDPPAVVVGQNVTITGTIDPIMEDVEVTIYYRHNATDELWTPLGTTTTDSDGTYTYTWTALEAGIFELEARWPGDELTHPAKSTPMSLTVQAQPSIAQYIPYVVAGMAIIGAGIAVYFVRIRE